jgi:hypothetical protein
VGAASTGATPAAGATEAALGTVAWAYVSELKTVNNKLKIIRNCQKSEWQAIFNLSFLLFNSPFVLA